MLPILLAAGVVLLVIALVGLLAPALLWAVSSGPAVPRASTGGAEGPSVPAKQAQADVLQRYARYRAGPLPTFEEFCYPKTYALQNQQAFAGEFMAPGSGNDALLVFHKIGAGKTCLSIQIGEKWKAQGRPLF